MKEFFSKKPVIIVEGVVIAAAAAGLLIAGTSAEDIAKVPSCVAGILAAIESLITLVQGFTKKD